jgi:hypothetical protein
VDHIFGELWTRVLKGSSAVVTADSGAKYTVGKGAKSIKHLGIARESMRVILKAKLKAFIVPGKCWKERKADLKVTSNKEEEKEKDSDVERVIIFLPPRYHLLLKFNIYENQTIVKIRTDFWRVLICLDDFFEDLIKV